MRAMLSMFCFCMMLNPGGLPAAESMVAKDTFPVGEDRLEVYFLGHGTLMFTFAGKVIHLDPVSRYADYSTLPRADLVLITHAHGDHLEQAGLAAVRTKSTTVIYSHDCIDKLDGGKLLENGGKQEFSGIMVEAVPAYNVQHERSPGMPYHPRGDGNGYLLTFGDLRVYVAGDTENIPEMKELQNVDIAFLPMNLPYTMTPRMTADAARLFHPKVLYPYHYGETDPEELVKLLAADKDIEVRIRDLR